MINTICIATRGWPPPSICHMRVRRGTKTQAGKHGSLGGALAPGGEALGAGARDPTQTKVQTKVSAGWSYRTQSNVFFAICEPPR